MLKIFFYSFNEQRIYACCELIRNNKNFLRECLTIFRILNYIESTPSDKEFAEKIKSSVILRE